MNIVNNANSNNNNRNNNNNENNDNNDNINIANLNSQQMNMQFVMAGEKEVVEKEQTRTKDQKKNSDQDERWNLQVEDCEHVDQFARSAMEQLGVRPGQQYLTYHYRWHSWLSPWRPSAVKKTNKGCDA